MSYVFGIKRLDGQKTEVVSGRRVWWCDSCNLPFYWNERSSWFGSMKDLEDGEWDRIRIACSDQCKIELTEEVA